MTPEGRFNEAGAGCPGIQGIGKKIAGAYSRASMRPGQAAPVFQEEPIRKGLTVLLQ